MEVTDFAIHVMNVNRCNNSGVETIAHLRETSRITIMFLEIEEGAPLILRLFGTATVHEPTSPSFSKFLPSTADRVPGTRAVISVEINHVTTVYYSNASFFPCCLLSYHDMPGMRLEYSYL